MRFLFALITFVMLLTIIVFAINNVGTTVSVNLIKPYPDLPLIAVVIAAITFGVIFVGIVAITEGAKTRFENVRLRKEVRKLETELNFLRTQPGTRKETSSMKAALPPAAGPAAPSREDAASAPVYEQAKAGDETDPEDDMYSGSGAV